MGKFTYENSISIDFEDRLLLHLQTVMASKLKRSEPFFFTFRDGPGLGDGRTTIWIHSGTGMTFKYYGSRLPSLNGRWLDALSMTANSPTGLYVVREPVEQIATIAPDAELAEAV